MKTFFTLLFTFISFIAVLAQENGGPYSSDENTVLLMHFNGDATNSADVENDGIEHGSGVSYEEGVHGQSLRLDNSTNDKQNWIEVPYFEDLNVSSDGLSVECWFKLNSWGENGDGTLSLFRKDGANGPADYEIILWPEGNEGRHGQVNLDCEDEEDRAWGADATIADILELNTWYYIVIYYNPYFIHEYVNEEGEQRQASSVYCLIRDENFEEIFASRGHTETPPTNSDGLFRIGFGGWENSYFDGWIDELRISNTYRKYRDDVLANVDTNAFPDSVFIPLKDSWTSYGWPLGEFYPRDDETGEIFKENACGPTMLARAIHYWEYPRFPEGVIEHNWDGYDWYANYDETEYLWDQIKPFYDGDATEEELEPVEVFGAQVGVASWKTFNNMTCMPKFLKENFLFSKRTRIVFEEEYTKEEWENIIRNELNNGRICMVGGWGHYYIINGYNSKNQFFTDYSFNDLYWNDIKDFDYGAMQDMIIYFEPDWGNKELKLEYPKTGDLFQKGSNIEIQWSAENISNLIIEYSSDAGYHWHTLADDMDANLASYSYTLPDSISDDYRIRISDKANLNVYRKSSGINVYDQKAFAFEYPKANTNFKKGTKQPVYWQSSGIKTCRLEYSINNSAWTIFCDSVSAKDGFRLANIPDIEADEIKLRAVELENPESVYESETFHLIAHQLWGGPYEKDDNTLLLMHFENSLKNEASNDLLPNELNSIGIFEDNYNKNMGRSFRVYNPDQYTADAIQVKNSENLDLGNNWTMETWVKVESIMGERTVASLIINKWDVFNISAGWQHFGAYIAFENGSSIDFYHPQEYNLDEWYHVAMVSDATKEKVSFYVHDRNYQQVYNDEKPFPNGSNGMVLNKEFINEGQDKNIVTIGGLGGGSNLELDGYLDELRITKSVVDYSSMTVGNQKIYVENNGLYLTCYPNPITSESVISFQTKTNGKVNLSVFDMQGRKICTLVDEKLNAGIHTIPVSSSLPANGVYLCKLITAEGISTKKLIVNAK